MNQKAFDTLKNQGHNEIDRLVVEKESITKEIGVLNDLKVIAQNTLDQTERKIAENQKIIKTQTDNIEISNKTIIEKEKKVEVLSKHLSVMSIHKVNLENKISELAAEVSNLTDLSGSTKLAIEASNARLAAINGEISRAEKVFAELIANIGKTKLESEAAKRELVEENDNLTKLKKRLMDIRIKGAVLDKKEEYIKIMYEEAGIKYFPYASQILDKEDKN